jgi:hypothetical protein
METHCLPQSQIEAKEFSVVANKDFENSSYA